MRMNGRFGSANCGVAGSGAGFDRTARGLRKASREAGHPFTFANDALDLQAVRPKAASTSSSCVRRMPEKMSCPPGSTAAASVGETSTRMPL